MPEETTTHTENQPENDARREARRREERWWKGGLIAALVFLGLATLYNGIAYRRLTRAQHQLVLSLTRQPYRPAFGPNAPPSGQGFSGHAYPPPFAGPWGYGGRPGWGCHRWHHHEQEQGHDQGQGQGQMQGPSEGQGQGQGPSAQPTPG
jgi:hypothetical protein